MRELVFVVYLLTAKHMPVPIVGPFPNAAKCEEYMYYRMPRLSSPSQSYECRAAPVTPTPGGCKLDLTCAR